MKKYLYFPALALCAGLCACTNDDIVDDVVKSSSNEIVMNPVLKNIQTRSTESHDLATDNLGAFSVTALHGENLYYENVDYIHTGSCWKSENKYYWPLEGDLTFYAYAPKEEANGITRENYNVYTVFQQSLASDQPDFIVSKTTSSKEKSAVSGVTLNFRHAMSRIALQVRNSNTGMKMLVSDWKVGNLYNQGSFSIKEENSDTHNANLTVDDWDFSGEGCEQTVNTELQSSEIIPFTIAEGSESQSVEGFNDFIAIPQQLIDNPHYAEAAEGSPFAGSYIAVEMEIKNAADDATIVSKQWCYWPIATMWEPGKKYTYVIDLAGGGYHGHDGDNGSVVDGELDPVLDNTEVFFVNCMVDEWNALPVENVKMPDLTDYLSFTAAENGKVYLKKYGSNWSRDVQVEYSFDKETWYSVEYDNPINVNTGQTVYFRGDNPAGFSESENDRIVFKTGGTFEVHGNVMTLVDPTGKEKTIPCDYCFKSLFYGTSISTAPELPATTLKSYCYADMFNSCEKLTEAPEIPATTVAKYSCYSMFQYCKSLITTPAILPATQLAPYCYAQMFEMCMTQMSVPELPALEMEDGCYFSMFRYTLIRNAPELPAMKLADRCYANMFAGCQYLTKAPDLPAEEIVGLCYGSMFNEATRLNYVKAMFTSIPENAGMGNWLNKVASNGTFVKSPKATWSGAYIPGGWTIIVAEEE